MKLQISIISLLLISSAFGATADFTHQYIAGTGAWSFTEPADAAYFSQYAYWMVGKSQKNGMDFWTGMKAACSAKVSYDATSDTEVDSWAVAFEAELTGGASICAPIMNDIKGAGFANNDAFSTIPFRVIKCYEALKEQLVLKPTTLGDAYLVCLKAGIVAVGYDVDAGLIGQFFRRSYKKWTSAEITQSTWDALVAANTDGKTYTNAAYAQCADNCENNSQSWVDEVDDGTKNNYQGIMPQQLHAKQLEVAVANCDGNQMSATAKPEDAFDTKIGTAMNVCVDALELWEYNQEENQKMQCYRQCANPTKPMQMAVAKTTSVDGEIRSEDGEYIIRKRTIIANYVGCIQKINTQTKTAINNLVDPVVWYSAAQGGAAMYTQENAANNYKEEFWLKLYHKYEKNWQYCMQATQSCKDFANWAMKGYEWAMDLPADAEKCVNECTKDLNKWINGRRFDSTTPNTDTIWQSNFALPEYAGHPDYKKVLLREECISTLKSEWAVERTSWINGQKASGSLLIFGSVIALVFGLLV